MRMAPPIDGLQPVEMTRLPIDKVRFQGDPVACIVASDRYLAEDAAELVRSTTSCCRPSATMWQALRPAGAALVDETLPSNLLVAPACSRTAIAARPLRRGARSSSRPSSRSIARPTLPIETRGCIADLGRGPRSTSRMHVGTQVPHPYRTQLARAAAPVRIAGHRDLARHRRRLRPEDRAVPRGTHRAPRWRAQLQAAGALARGPHGEPARPRRRRARTSAARAPPSTRRAACWRSSSRSSRTSAPTASTRATTWRASSR